MKIKKSNPQIIFCLFLFLILFLTMGMSADIRSGNRYQRLLIKNVNMIDGNGTPAQGPVDILIINNRIDSIRNGIEPTDKDKQETEIIDGSGMVAIPGLINIHAHIHHERGGIEIPSEYLYKLWLSCGITTVRDVGSNSEKTIIDRKKSLNNEITAPRIFLYMIAWGRTDQQLRSRVQEIKRLGGDGVKIFGMDRDLLAAVTDEAHKLGLPVAHHLGVEETDAWDDARFKVTSIEHWYGIPDAALHGSQKFPADYNYDNENHRFRYAGHLWRETDPAKLDKVLQEMITNGVNWNPTFVIYEANRDLLRASNQPWFKDYLHPVLEQYFKPDPKNHGSYFWKWTTEDEIFWKENYQIWMAAVNRFARLGGVVGVGEDAGYIYMLYGFSLIRELELHQEAGFHPLDVIKHATVNNALILKKENELGRIRQGFLADLILVKGNPLENFKYLYPGGSTDMVNGKIVHKGSIEWTIKDGIPYHVPSLLQEIREMVAKARSSAP